MDKSSCFSLLSNFQRLAFPLLKNTKKFKKSYHSWFRDFKLKQEQEQRGYKTIIQSEKCLTFKCSIFLFFTCWKIKGNWEKKSKSTNLELKAIFLTYWHCSFILHSNAKFRSQNWSSELQTDPISRNIWKTQLTMTYWHWSGLISINFIRINRVNFLIEFR